MAVSILSPPEEPLGQWGTDGLWYPAPLPPHQQTAGGWDPGILGLGYEPNSGAWWDPQAQAWLQQVVGDVRPGVGVVAQAQGQEKRAQVDIVLDERRGQDRPQCAAEQGPQQG